MAAVFTTVAAAGDTGGPAADDPQGAGEAPSAPDVVSISLSTNLWSVGVLPENGVADTWYVAPGTFAVTNTGTVAVRLLVTVSNTVPSGWVPAPVPGPNRFHLALSVENGASGPAYQSVYSPGLTLSGVLNTNEVLQFDLRLQGPESTPDINVEQDIPISILALPAG